MTTIAYDGEYLVGDKQWTHYEQTPVSAQKIFLIENNDVFQAIGFAGNPDSLYEVLRQLEDSKYPIKLEEKSIEFNALLIDYLGGAWLITKHGEPQPVPTPWAIGSGSQFALGAMEAGATAIEAVCIATIFDISTGLGYDEIKID